MNKKYIIAALIFTLVIGILADFSWVKEKAQKQSIESTSYLINNLNRILNKIEKQLEQLRYAHNPCSEENRLKLEEIIFSSSIVKNISYIKNERLICSDRNIEPNQLFNIEYLNQIKDTNGYSLYRSINKVRNVENIVFMLPAGDGWFRVLLNARYLDTWLAILSAELNVRGCLVDHQNNPLDQCDTTSVNNFAFKATQESYSYPFTVISGYSNRMLFQLMLEQRPYPLIIFLALSAIMVLLFHTFYYWRYSLLSNIKRGLKNREFYSVYQPIVCSETGSWQGAELLARWTNQKGIIISPANFIPEAEQSGVISNITLQLLERAAYDKQLINKISPNSYISVNVTVSMISNPHYVDSLIGLINKYPSLQSNLVFEFTEREPFLDSKRSLLQTGMQKLREVGVRWALDDFGTGYAGLAILQSLRFDILKIDGIFVTASVTNPISSNILGNIARDSKLAKWTVVAEGVETEEQALHIAQLGIQLSQGFYYAKPMPFDEYLGKLERMQSPSQAPLAGQHKPLDIDQ